MEFLDQNTVTDVLSVVNQIIDDWGDGRVRFYKKKKILRARKSSTKYR